MSCYANLNTVSVRSDQCRREVPVENGDAGDSDTNVFEEVMLPALPPPPPAPGSPLAAMAASADPGPSSAALLPLSAQGRHVAATRLPSLPERRAQPAQRVDANSAVPEPLPACE